MFEEESKIKKYFYYAIMPALVAGFFSISPKIYDIMSEPNMELKYKIIESPELIEDKIYKKILSVTVENKGKKTLTNIIGDLLVINGKVHNYKIQDDFAIKPNIITNDNNLNIFINNIHPNEKLELILMLITNKEKSEFTFNLRSNEIVGTKIDITDIEKIKKNDSLFTLLLTILSVLTMALWLISKKRSILSRDQRKETLFYILSKLELDEIIILFIQNNKRITFLWMSDILYFNALQDKDNKEKYINALKCMLLIKYIANTSVSVIIRNIKLLEGHYFSEEQIKDLQKSAIDDNIDNSSFRNSIDKFLEKSNKAIEQNS